jgi:hypothetical protein
MGRHSAPDESGETLVADVSLAEPDAADPAALIFGRHSVQADLPIAKPAATVSAAKAAPKPRSGGTHADLQLLREQPALRARCAAAVVVPFLLYTVVLLVVGQLGSFLLWAWIPTVTAGVSVGSFLDAAHRRSRDSTSAAQVD